MRKRNTGEGYSFEIQKGCTKFTGEIALNSLF